MSFIIFFIDENSFLTVEDFIWTTESFFFEQYPCYL